ncbi:hypothetical protein FRUB_04713 [Fimbriiglobus ruber]|uniref:Uncharacterized protein n=1 Tax=Fimbriiglobus ruber TaxID=1908690 RepID=A0A225DH36_9BACT|nr:hypothetical protein FRUB_04713 [Fimbriiglobus ruber]
MVEQWCFRAGVSWLSAKWQIIREAIRAYRVCPVYRMPQLAEYIIGNFCHTNVLRNS